MMDEGVCRLPLQYEDGPEYCTVKDARGQDFALTMQPELMKAMEKALSADIAAVQRPPLSRTKCGASQASGVAQAAPRCARCGSSGDTYVLCSGCGMPASPPYPVEAVLRECASRCRYDGDLFHDQGNIERRDASWKAAEMAADALSLVSSRDRAAPPSVALEAGETEAAGRIIDVMTGGKFDWRSRIDDSDFLNSADWQCAVSYARAALTRPQPGGAVAGTERQTPTEGERE